jgi:hypothetical protein
MAFEARRQILLSGSNKTFIDFMGFCMFDEEDFCKMWAMHMKDHGFPFTEEMLDRMEAGAGSHYEILPEKDYFKCKEESLLYDKGKVINLDGSPIEYFFMLYAKAFEKAVYVGVTLLLNEWEALLRQQWRMVGIDSWRSLMQNANSPAWCDTLEGVTKALLVDFWPDDYPEELKEVQGYALIFIPRYLAHYALKFLNKESRRYLKDLSLLGNKGFYDMFSAAILSQTHVEDGFEEPEDTLTADALATAEKRNL